MRRSFVAVASLTSFLFLLTGCPDAPVPAAPEAPAPKAEPEADAETEPGEEAAAAADVVEPADEAYPGVVVARVSGLRRAPTTDRQVPADDGDGQMSNWITHLYRGDSVKVLRTEDGWSWVEVPGGDEGWVQHDGLRKAEGAEPATVLEEARIFERPDPTRPAAGRTVPPGKFLLVLESHEGFSSVNTRGEASVWVRTQDLVRDADEIAVSRIINRVRWMKEQDREEGMADLLDVARDQYEGAKLLAVLEAEIEGDTPEDATAEAKTAPAGTGEASARPAASKRSGTGTAPSRRGSTRESGRRPTPGSGR